MAIEEPKTKKNSVVSVEIGKQDEDSDVSLPDMDDEGIQSKHDETLAEEVKAGEREEPEDEGECQPADTHAGRRRAHRTLRPVRLDREGPRARCAVQVREP